MNQGNRRTAIPFAPPQAVSPRRHGHLFLHPARAILMGFFVVIMMGTALLMLPRATAHGTTGFLDALFTATSATCVTGLVVFDTGSHFSGFGQGVILVLIQIGGLGIMTLSTFFVYLISGRLSLTEQEIVQGTLGQHPISDLARLLKLVFFVTIGIEIIGATLLAMRFSQTLPWLRAAYFGLFHAISAFCNAGFALFSDSFESYRGDLFVNSVLAGLIVLGGIGFVVLFDLYRNFRPFRSGTVTRLGFHTRLVLFMSSLLILSGMVMFMGLEFHNTLADGSFSQKLLPALFQSITARTAGFNTVDIGKLSNATLFLLMILMFIGASPGSCGGGIKTSTFAVVMASVFARFRMREDVNIFYRRIASADVSRAISVVFFSGIIVAVFAMLLLVVELPQISHVSSRGLFVEYVFEVISAFGTVGLSTGVTSTLSQAGKIIITFLMFIGRLGPLTIALAVQGTNLAPKYRYVQENVLVG